MRQNRERVKIAIEGEIQTKKRNDMKNVFCKLCLALAVVAAAVGCKSFHTLSSTKKVAQGAPYELLVVCNAPEWEGELGEALRALLEEPVPMLNQAEPHFDVLRITAGDFRNILTEHRNILKVVVSPQVAQTAIIAQYDVAAAPQLVMTFQGASQQAMVEYLRTNGDALLRVLEMAERDRTVKYAERHNVQLLNELIKEEFGVDMRVPKGYELRSQSADFLWASYEFPAASQGFFIYTYPYRGKGSLSVERLVAMRNEFARRIPGPSDGSYMVTVEQIPDAETGDYTPFEPDYAVVQIGDRKWIEMRGFWDVAGDFMGGPFVSYTTVNEAAGEVFTIDCYVHSPKDGKRNYIRALEHLVYLVKFPAVKTAE
jgi:hypothetical protein